MTILLLGGIAEAQALAASLIERRFDVVYSIAGLVRKPDLGCVVRVGGFSGPGRDGVAGMVCFIRETGIERIVDATHPYAARISDNAAQAAKRTGIACWRYQRPGWDAELHDARGFDGWDDLLPMLHAARRPFFTLGRSALDNLGLRLPAQHWIVRTAVAAPAAAGATIVQGIGPFDYDHERALMRAQRVDALVTKNSGGRGADKLRAARDLGIPVLAQRRPALPEADRCFDHLDDLLQAFCRRGRTAVEADLAGRS